MRRLGGAQTLRGQAEAFAAGFELALLDPRIWIPVRLATAASLVALAWAASSLPGLRDFFQLQPMVPLALLFASIALVFSLGLLNRSGVYSPTFFFVGLLVYAFLEEMASASFAVFSEAPGAFVLATLPVLRAALNGLGLGAPAGLAAFTAAHGLGVVAAAALRPDAPHAWLLLLTAPVSMGTFLFLAGASDRLARGRVAVAAQAAALQAQLVVERASHLQASNATLGELRQRRHDVRSALSTARLAADRIAPFLRGDPARWPLVQELIGALDALQRLLAERRAPRDDASGPALERVELEPVVRAVLEGVRERAPALRASVEVAPRATAARVRGGSVALYQILEQLLTNAAEGDGGRRARHVGVAVLADEHAGSLAIRIADDGPGFRPLLLGRPIAPFVTTKPHGVGLGLYTAERLACASGGSVRLENRPEGGAAVTVYLELAADAAAASSPGEEPPCARSGSSIASGS